MNRASAECNGQMVVARSKGASYEEAHKEYCPLQEGIHPCFRAVHSPQLGSGCLQDLPFLALKVRATKLGVEACP